MTRHATIRYTNHYYYYYCEHHYYYYYYRYLCVGALKGPPWARLNPVRDGWPLALDRARGKDSPMSGGTANLPTKILDSRGFDSSIILILRGGILMPIGNLLEMLSQGILVGIILVIREIGRSGSCRLLQHAAHCRTRRIPSCTASLDAPQTQQLIINDRMRRYKTENGKP